MKLPAAASPRPPASTIALALLAFAACASGPTPAPAPGPASPPPAASELRTVDSAHDHAATVDRAVAAIEGRGLVVVQRVDHRAAAQTAGLELEPTTVLVFGHPKAGTPLMQVAPTIALDLPLRLLVWQRDGRVQVAYRAPAAIAAAHGVEAHPAVAKMGEAVAAIVDAATR